MSKSLETSLFDTIYALLPSALKTDIDDLLSRSTGETSVRRTLDELVRFCLSRDSTDLDTREEWDTQRQKVEKALSNLCSESDNGRRKRAREGDVPDNPKAKKAKGGSVDSGDDNAIFTLHTISASSPVRKKVNITMHRDRIRLTHPTSGAQEASIPFTALNRAFLIPTPGKSKPHWTVIILTDAEQDQIIFGLDAVPASLSTTAHPASPHTHPKGTEVKPVLAQFLSHLPPGVVLQEPSTSQFRSATGEPFLDAYLRAKDGHLLFFKDGILFGEKKPCVWIEMGEIHSVRSLSATGRTFSLFVRYVSSNTERGDGAEAEGGEETEFSMIDGKNQEPVARWVQDNRHRFGIRQAPTEDPKGEEHGEELAADEDTPEKKAHEDSDDDSDFESDFDSDGGSATSESSDINDSGEEEAEMESNSDEEEGDIYDPSRHPLLREGAVPKMSRSAVDAVVGMIEQDLVSGSGSHGAKEDEDVDEDVDELEE